NDTQGTGLLSFITSFFNSFQSLSVNPTSLSNREAVKQAGQSLSNEFHSQAVNLRNQQWYANRAVSDDIGKINSLTSQIADVTRQILNQETPDQPQNELRDQRSELVRQLSQIIDVK